MDDCTLEKLVVKPGKLLPSFDKNHLEYEVTVPSSVQKINIDPLTSDSGASYCIFGGDGGKDVPLKEGAVTDVKIEVTSEDGTIKHYFIHAKRLSAKDAFLSDLELSVGDLNPEFNPDVFSYSCLLPCNVAQVVLKPKAPDNKNVVLVCGEKPGTPTALNVGETNVTIEVTSADGSNKKTYVLDVIRKQIPRFVKLVDDNLAKEFECPFTLSALYRPISIQGGSPKNTYSAPNIDEKTRKTKIDPLSGMPLGKDWRIVDYELDKKIAVALATIPLTNGKTLDPTKFSELAAEIEKCNVVLAVEDVTDKFKNVMASVKHSVEVRKWEKNLIQIFDESDVGTLCKNAEICVMKYFSSLPKSGQSKQWPHGERPLDFLEQASFNYAVAIKSKPKDASLHMKLGQVLEERYYTEDLFGLKKEEGGESLPSFNFEAKESSKEEECAAICQLRGVDAATAPIALQLKAIDEEYHHLVSSGQSGKSDHVQGLYVWKSKMASQEGMAAQKAQDEESSLGQAYLKYMDALTLDEPKAIYNFHVGRMLVIQGNFDDAVKRLEATLNWNPKHQFAKFYLGLALALQKNGPGARAKETITYLLEAMETLLTEQTNAAMTSDDPRNIPPILHSDNLLRSSNVHLLRGIVNLGKLLQKNTDVKDCMSPEHVFHTSALLASQVLPYISRGDTYKQLEWVLLESHSNLLDILLKDPVKNATLIEQRCQRLSALIMNSTLPMNEDLLNLQEQTCQKLVSLKPCSSLSLYRLGVSQFAKYENCPPGDTANKILKETMTSYQACISMEGKPASGDPPETLTEQQWWQDKVKAEEEDRKAKEAKKAPPPAATKGGPAKPGPTARGGGAAGRGAPAVRGAPATRGRGTATTPARGGATAGRGGSNRGGATAKAPAGKAAPAPTAPKAPAGKGGHQCEATPSASKAGATAPPAQPKEETKPENIPESKPADSKPAPINQKTYHPRLGLARAYRSSGDIDQSKKFYNEVMVMAPEVHDACIELAEMLAKSDPKGAVDVYCKFHISDPPTFDDGFILGEIVRLLMKAEDYEDKRLVKNMILYGKVYGLAVLEKYVKILEEKFKNKILQEVYAGVNGKSVDDPDMQAFFQFRCWL
ncbi:uncharacterized protein LOC125651820 isoform X2 [Ostrea edulis]|uniref:uncharacterized protein LOC125651820 isoform X2 n=1 Tax=Ostrea edulis TaxID=37623 RepID=UPI0024AFE57B|nr:uncharacterized protein LOC125651820 isoform X2 [Ostrea edulis]